VREWFNRKSTEYMERERVKSAAVKGDCVQRIER